MGNIKYTCVVYFSRMQQQIQHILEEMRNHAFRITPQRVAIVEYVINTESHPSAEEIHRIISRKYPMVSLATVYKTLDLLKRLGVVKELGFAEGARYDSNLDKHVNLVCIRCGKIEDVKDNHLEELELRISKRSRYRILSARFEFEGYCEQCRSKS